MAGWLLHRPWAVKLGSEQPEIVFSTGLHWALLGVGLTALAVGTRRPSARWPDRIACVVGSVTTALCVMRLLEVITGWAVALDFASVHVWSDRHWQTGEIGGMHPGHALASAAIALCCVPTL